jgi:hypothetical protein
MQSETTAALRLIHGTELCHICGLPKAEEGRSICSYPHAMVPVKAVDLDHPEGFWTWSEPDVA